MARRITEEQLTKVVLNWLEDNAWKIICFDFPQSGTGVVLHPNKRESTNKNKGSIIPDIVAIKNEVVLFFENKDRFFLADYEKISKLRDTDLYANSINSLLVDFKFTHIFYGVGIYFSEINEVNDAENWDKIDFSIMVEDNENILIKYDPYHIFL